MSEADKTRLLGSDQTRILTQMPGQMSDRTVVSTALPPPGLMRALNLSAVLENPYALSTEVSRSHALFDIRTGGNSINVTGMGGGARLPLNIALVIDRSGSMDGEPLDYAKRACGYVVDLLEPNDVLSVIAFEDRADVIMPARRVVNKALVKDYINRIYAGNTTNLYEGLMTAYQQVASVKSENSLNRVLLLTDGEPTAGTKDFQSIVGQVAEQKARGITVTALGFGPDYNEELMAGIARRSGGNYYYIARPELIPEVFRKELDTLMRITARNLRLRLLLSRGVTVRQVYGQQPIYGARSTEAVLIDVERETGLTSLWELEATPRPAGVYRVAQAELLYDDAVTGQLEKLTADIVWEFTPDAAKVASGINPRVQNEIEVARAARSLDKTIMGMRTQALDLTMLMNELNRTKTLMMNKGMLAQAQEITQAMQEIQSGGSAEKTLTGTVYNLDQGKTK